MDFFDGDTLHEEGNLEAFIRTLGPQERAAAASALWDVEGLWAPEEDPANLSPEENAEFERRDVKSEVSPLPIAATEGGTVGAPSPQPEQGTPQSAASREETLRAFADRMQEVPA